MPQILCALDLDNTLYNFIDFFGPAYRGMLHALSRKTLIDFESLNESAKEVIYKHGSIEYPLLVREMDVFKLLDDTHIKELEKLAVSSHGRVRRRLLKPYDGMKESLVRLRNSGAIIGAVTNASIYKAVRRLEALRLVNYFDYIVGVNEKKLPDDVARIGMKSPWEKYPRLKIIGLDESQKKPSTYPFQALIDAVPKKKYLYAVGDNIGRDLRPANLLGYRTIWAKYGCEVNTKNYETVLYLTPSVTKQHEIAVSDYKPDYIANSASDISDIIAPNLFTPNIRQFYYASQSI